MHRIVSFAFAAAGLLAIPFSATPLSATPPSPPVPLEVRLANMDVIVVGLLHVQGEGPDRKVTLDVSHVLKKPEKLMRLEPGLVLKVRPRPEGFSDQGGEGVWSLQFDGPIKDLYVTKYEFITYGREWERIKTVLDETAVKATTPPSR
ncbi:MAG: hypothetical protein RIC55_16195 [Pirellulaceae bacterium]